MDSEEMRQGTLFTSDGEVSEHALSGDPQERLRFLQERCARGGNIEVVDVGGYTCFVDEEGLYNYAATNPNPALEDLIGAHELRGNVFVLARGVSALKELFLEYYRFQQKGDENPLMLMIHQPDKFTVEIVTYLTSEYEELKRKFID